MVGEPQNSDSDPDHGRVRNLLIALLRERAVVLQRDVPVQQTLLRHSVIRESQEPIRVARVAVFWPDVPHIDALERSSGLQIPQLHNKILHPMPFPVNYQLRRNNRVVRVKPLTSTNQNYQLPNPPFRGRNRRRVQNKCLRVFIERRGGLQPLHIRTVTQFGLRVTACMLIKSPYQKSHSNGSSAAIYFTARLTRYFSQSR